MGLQNQLRSMFLSISRNNPVRKHIQILIAEKLVSIEFLNFKETVQKSILTDILEVLVEIKKYQTNDKIEDYINKALSYELLDKIIKNVIEGLLHCNSDN